MWRCRRVTSRERLVDLFYECRAKSSTQQIVAARGFGVRNSDRARRRSARCCYELDECARVIDASLMSDDRTRCRSPRLSHQPRTALDLRRIEPSDRLDRRTSIFLATAETSARYVRNAEICSGRGHGGHTLSALVPRSHSRPLGFDYESRVEAPPPQILEAALPVRQERRRTSLAPTVVRVAKVFVTS